VLERAKQLGINLSRASERGVREEIQEAEARRWADDNAEFEPLNIDFAVALHADTAPGKPRLEMRCNWTSNKRGSGKVA
jgi:hypothetical protein